jgi:iron complex outermembrane receptor protein
MKKIVVTVMGVAMTTMAVAQQQWHYDSTKVEKLSEVVVNGVRAQKNAPYAVSNLTKKQLKESSKTGRELPFLFAQTPGVLAWSENGLGTGTTYMRIRGAGDSRINVTLDGVALNSPEDQCVFWANMNSYGSLLGSVQIQRGVGTSTNGDGAFGGSIALQTATPQQTPGLEVSASYGSYNTLNIGGNLSTGLLGNHWILDGAYHQTTTDGFIHGTSGRSGSYYGGLSWLCDNIVVAYKNIGNFESTGQAWNGVTAGDNDLSLMDGTYGAQTGINTYKDMWDRGLGKYNTLYETLAYDADGNFAKDADDNYLTNRYTMADGSYWNKTTDNFWQNHNLLSLAWTVNNHWSTTATVHYTYGYGYYEEFRPQNKLSKFGLTASDAEGKNIKRTDFIRRKGLTQHTYGLVWNANYDDEHWNVVGGLSIQEFDGTHFGFLTYAAHEAVRNKYLSNGHYRYYDSKATKLDNSYFLKAAYHITPQFDLFADMQYRHVDYQTGGLNDKFYEEDSRYFNQLLDINKKYDFLNPKGGFSWSLGNHRLYGSVAMSHREPERNNFTDNGSYPAPKAEQLIDYEAGYTYNSQLFRAGVNFYYMDYKDQFVQTGLKSDIGENLTTNIKDSYRMGLELQAGIDPTPWLTIEGNAALSRNKIKDFDEVVEDWDNGSQTIHYDNSTLAFSPSAILNGFVNLHHKGLEATWHTNFVSRQYLDNTQNKDRSLPCYSTSSLQLSYTLRAKPGKSGCAFPVPRFKEVVFGLNFNNIFNRRYAASGWVYSAIYESGGHTNDNRYYQIGFIPMSGFTMMGNVALRF